MIICELRELRVILSPNPDILNIWPYKTVQWWYQMVILWCFDINYSTFWLLYYVMVIMAFQGLENTMVLLWYFVSKQGQSQCWIYCLNAMLTYISMVSPMYFKEYLGITIQILLYFHGTFYKIVFRAHIYR